MPIRSSVLPDDGAWVEPARDAEAIKMILTGLSHLAAADHTATAAQAQAECLRALEQGYAIFTAARAGPR